MDVSNKIYKIRDNPVVGEERIVADFVSGDHLFHELVLTTDEEAEIWYIDRNDPSNSVLAFGYGEYEVEYRYLQFEPGSTIDEPDLTMFLAAYEDTEPARKLYINGEIASINEMNKGSINYQGVSYEWDNSQNGSEV